jgi:hypothetical protein
LLWFDHAAKVGVRLGVFGGFGEFFEENVVLAPEYIA